MSRVFGPALVGVALVAYATTANAALTSSEKGQIKDFVAAARTSDAQKVRSLVARTDLTPDESAAVLTEALAMVPFTEQRGAFLSELAFGDASAPSRPVLVVTIVKALVARADSIYGRYVGGLDHEPRAVDELFAIYGWLDRTIANAGKPTASAHDGGVGIPASHYEECSKVLRDHLERQARWLKGDGAIPASVAHLRAQAQLAVFDMLPDGLTRRVDAADRLGLKGARRSLLTEWGILFADDGATSEAKVERARQLLARLPGVRSDLAAIKVGGRDAALRARGDVVYVTRAEEPYPFPDEESHGAAGYDSSGIAYELALTVAKRALAKRADLRAQVETDARAAFADGRARLLGKPHAPSVEHVLGAAIHAVLVDASRAIDLSFARLLGARSETASLLSDAVGALATFPLDDKDAKALKLEVGKGEKWAPMVVTRTAPNGAALGFTFDDHAWSIDRAEPSYVTLAGRRDGKPVSPDQLKASGIPRDGTQWMESGYTFKKVRGAPRVALSGSPHEKGKGPSLRFIGAGTDGFDVITVSPPGPDFVFEGELKVGDAQGGVLLRASRTAKGIRGAGLLVTPGGQAVLTVVEDGAMTNLGAPIDPSPTAAIPVKLSVTGKKVEATVGKTVLSGTLPDSFAAGDVAVIGKKNANVDITAFTLKKN